MGLDGSGISAASVATCEVDAVAGFKGIGVVVPPGLASETG